MTSACSWRLTASGWLAAGYVDGNKCIAFLATYVFLGLNGLEIEAAEPGVVAVMTALAAGELDEGAFRLVAA